MFLFLCFFLPCYWGVTSTRSNANNKSCVLSAVVKTPPDNLWIMAVLTPLFLLMVVIGMVAFIFCQRNRVIFKTGPFRTFKTRSKVTLSFDFFPFCPVLFIQFQHLFLLSTYFFIPSLSSSSAHKNLKFHLLQNALEKFKTCFWMSDTWQNKPFGLSCSLLSDKF